MWTKPMCLPLSQAVDRISIENLYVTVVIRVGGGRGV